VTPASTNAAALHVTAARGGARTLSTNTMIEILILAAVLFNAVLSLVNAHAMPLTPAYVIAAEVLILTACVALIASGLRHDDRPWLILMLAVLWIGLTSSLMREQLAAKSIRDVAIIPIFVMLGLRYSASPVRVFTAVQLAVFSVVLIEAFDQYLFATLFAVKSYYINTRDFSAETFWNEASELFLSATRPSDRFIPLFDLHRMSSVFLEPVSLGNYVCIVVIFLTAYWTALTRRQKLWFAFTTLFLLAACDGRLATVTCLFIIGVGLIVAVLPPRIFVLYLPAAVLGACLVVLYLAPQASGDNFTGRLAVMVGLLSNLSLADLVAVSPLSSLGRHYDSGVTYLVVTQTLVGAALVWASITLVPHIRARRQAVIVHGTCLFVAFNLLVSYSVFSIKTAAVLWFLYGTALRHPTSGPTPCDATT
jgi:putative polymerase